jgi:hypothetical protein
MAVLASKLIEKSKSLSPEEQEEIAQRMEERISSMFKLNALESVGKSLQGISHPVQGLSQSALSRANLNFQDLLGISTKGVLQSFQEDFKSSFSSSFNLTAPGLTKDIFKDGNSCFEPFYGVSGVNIIPRQQKPERTIIYVPVFIPLYEPPSLN